eukprot:m.61920 g.61920  ORF g.61920 m.61920 type:complete len:51 (-) comp23056_c0_seq2:258-410(-)
MWIVINSVDQKSETYCTMKECCLFVTRLFVCLLQECSFVSNLNYIFVVQS